MFSNLQNNSDDIRKPSDDFGGFSVILEEEPVS